MKCAAQSVKTKNSIAAFTPQYCFFALRRSKICLGNARKIPLPSTKRNFDEYIDGALQHTVFKAQTDRIACFFTRSETPKAIIFPAGRVQRGIFSGSYRIGR